MFDPLLIKAILDPLLQSRGIIAYSGGLDSHVLLHALSVAYADKKTKFKAVHINHGWHDDAEKWTQHCLTIANSLGIECEVINISAERTAGESLEATARDRRYAALKQIMETNDLLLTAHQQDDQAETLLLQLFRGSGIKGLSSMPKITGFSTGFHIRPLLDFTREELEIYAQQNNLTWIEDSSNTNVKFDRNFIRHEIFPKIKQHWPAVTKTLARTANHCAEAQLLLEEMAQTDLHHCTGNFPATLSIKKSKKLERSRWQNAFRVWLTQLNFSLPSVAQLHRVYEDILWSAQDSSPKISWGNVEVRRYQDDLYVLPILSLHNANAVYPWNLQDELQIPQVGTLKATCVLGRGIRENAFADKLALVKFRQFSERCHPAGRQGSHPLKKLFQEWRVPPWQRNKIPLLYLDEQLVSVVGYCICEPFAAKKDGVGIIVNLINL